MVWKSEKSKNPVDIIRATEFHANATDSEMKTLIGTTSFIFICYCGKLSGPIDLIVEGTSLLGKVSMGEIIAVGASLISHQLLQIGSLQLRQEN